MRKIEPELNDDIVEHEEEASDLFLKIDPSARRYSVASLSVTLLLGSYAFCLLCFLPVLVTTVTAIGLETGTAVVLAAVVLLVVPLSIMHVYGVAQRASTVELAALPSSPGSVSLDPKLRALLETLERQAARDARAMGIHNLPEVRYQERGGTIVTVAVTGGHIIVMGIPWLRELWRRWSQRGLKFESVLRSMLLHELGHVMARDVMLLGLVNLYMFLGWLGLLAESLSSLGSGASWPALVVRVLLGAALMLPHAYVARRRESHADTVALRFQGLLDPLATALGVERDGEGPVHGLSGALGRHFSRNRRGGAEVAPGIIERVWSLLDHHFDARKRASQLKRCIGKLDELHVRDYFVFGITAQAVPLAVVAAVTLGSFLVSGSNPLLVDAHSLQIFIATIYGVTAGAVVFILFNAVAEHVLLTRGALGTTGTTAVGFAAGMAVPTSIILLLILYFVGGELGFGAFEYIQVAWGLIVGFGYNYLVCRSYVRQANLLTHTLSLSRFRIGARLCGGVAASMSAFVNGLLVYGLFSDVDDRAFDFMVVILSLTHLLLHRYLIEAMIRRITSRRHSQWRCHACGHDNELIHPELVVGDAAEQPEDACTHCRECGTFALGQLFVPVRGHLDPSHDVVRMQDHVQPVAVNPRGLEQTLWLERRLQVGEKINRKDFASPIRIWESRVLARLPPIIFVLALLFMMVGGALF